MVLQVALFPLGWSIDLVLWLGCLQWFPHISLSNYMHKLRQRIILLMKVCPWFSWFSLAIYVVLFVLFVWKRYQIKQLIWIIQNCWLRRMIWNILGIQNSQLLSSRSRIESHWRIVYTTHVSSLMVVVHAIW